MEKLLRYHPESLPECMSCEKVGELRLCADCGCAVCGMVCVTAVGGHILGCKECGQQGGWWVHSDCWDRAPNKLRSKTKSCSRCGKSFREERQPTTVVEAPPLQAFSLTKQDSKSVRKQQGSKAKGGAAAKDKQERRPRNTGQEPRSRTSSGPRKSSSNAEKTSRISTGGRTSAASRGSRTQRDTKSRTKGKSVAVVPAATLKELLEKFESQYTANISRYQVARCRPVKPFLNSCADFPTYRDEIEHPICLSDIAAKVRDGTYLKKSRPDEDAGELQGEERKTGFGQLPACLREWAIVSETLPLGGTGHSDLSKLIPSSSSGGEEEANEKQKEFEDNVDAASSTAAARRIFFGIRSDLLLLRRNCFKFNKDSEAAEVYIVDAQRVCTLMERQVLSVFLEPKATTVQVKEEVVSSEEEEEDAVPPRGVKRVARTSNKPKSRAVVSRGRQKRSRDVESSSTSSDDSSESEESSDDSSDEEEDARARQQRRSHPAPKVRNWMRQGPRPKKQIAPPRKVSRGEDPPLAILARGGDVSNAGPIRIAPWVAPTPSIEAASAPPVSAEIQETRRRFEKKLQAMRVDPHYVAMRQTAPAYWTFDALHFHSLRAKTSSSAPQPTAGEGSGSMDAGLAHLNVQTPMDIEMDPTTGKPIRLRHYIYSQPRVPLPADTIPFSKEKIPEILGSRIMGILKQNNQVSLETKREAALAAAKAASPSFKTGRVKTKLQKPAAASAGADDQKIHQQVPSSSGEESQGARIPHPAPGQEEGGGDRVVVADASPKSVVSTQSKKGSKGKASSRGPAVKKSTADDAAAPKGSHQDAGVDLVGVKLPKGHLPSVFAEEGEELLGEDTSPQADEDVDDEPTKHDPRSFDDLADESDEGSEDDSLPPQQQHSTLTFAELRAQKMERNKARLGKLNLGK